MKYRGSQSKITLSSAGLGYINIRDFDVEDRDERILLDAFSIFFIYQ